MCDGNKNMLFCSYYLERHLGTPEPRPRRSKPGLPSNGERYDSSSSLSSMSSSFSLTPGKKKKPAPPPPSQIPAGQTLTPSYLNSKQASPCTSAVSLKISFNNTEFVFFRSQVESIIILKSCLNVLFKEIIL